MVWLANPPLYSMRIAKSRCSLFLRDKTALMDARVEYIYKPTLNIRIDSPAGIIELTPDAYRDMCYMVNHLGEHFSQVAKQLNIPLTWLICSSSATSTERSLLAAGSAVSACGCVFARLSGAGCKGSTKVKQLPRPRVLSTEMEPPICSIRALVMASPSSLPPARREREASAWVKESKIIAC